MDFTPLLDTSQSHRLIKIASIARTTSDLFLPSKASEWGGVKRPTSLSKYLPETSPSSSEVDSRTHISAPIPKSRRPIAPFQNSILIKSCVTA